MSNNKVSRHLSLNPFDNHNDNNNYNTTNNNIDSDIHLLLHQPLLSSYNNTDHTTHYTDIELDTIYSLSLQQLREQYNSYYKIILLFCLCLFTLGSYYCYDLPGAIQEQLTALFATKHIIYDTTNTLILYSIYSLPNCVLALFGGFIIDHITGIRYGCILFCSLVTIGNIIFATGVQIQSFVICIVGRVIYALGSESLVVSQNTMIVRWFNPVRLSFIFGIVASFSRIGSSINFIVTPLLTDKYNTTTAVWLAVSTCIISLIACCIASVMDCIMSSKIDIQRNNTIDTLPDNIKHAVLQHDQHNADERVNNDTISSLTDIQYFPYVSWLLFIICGLSYIPVLTFNEIASELIQHITQQQFNADSASALVSIPNIIAIFAVPLFGYIVDIYGYALYGIIVGNSMLITTQLSLFLIYHNILSTVLIPYTMIIQGIGYSIIASTIWPMLSYIVDNSQLATAYGMMTSIQNLSLSIAPLILSLMYTNYQANISFFIITALCAIIITILLITIDKHSDNILNTTSSERIAKQQQSYNDDINTSINYSQYVDNQIGY